MSFSQTIFQSNHVVVKFTTKFLHAGTLPYVIDVASLPIGSYVVRIAGVDIFNLTDEDFITYESEYSAN